MINWEELKNEWSGSGWDEIWKDFIENRVRPYVEENEEEEKNFYIESKEKFGMLRVIVSIPSEPNLSFFIEVISEFTCKKCGKQPKNSRGEHIIWKSSKWIQPFCKECARKFIHDKYMKPGSVLEKHKAKSVLHQKFESFMSKETLKGNLFLIRQLSKDSSTINRYQWINNWIVPL